MKFGSRLIRSPKLKDDPLVINIYLFHFNMYTCYSLSVRFPRSSVSGTFFLRMCLKTKFFYSNFIHLSLIFEIRKLLFRFQNKNPDTFVCISNIRISNIYCILILGPYTFKKINFSFWTSFM